MVDRVIVRKQKHRNALVAIEKQGNEYLNLVSDNLFVINDYTTIATKQIKEKQPFTYFNELHEVPIDKTITVNLGNIDMVNELFNLEASTAKVNSSIRSINKFIVLMQDALVNKNIDLDTYFVNVKSMIEKLAELAVFLHDFDEENKLIVAKARVLLRSGDNSVYSFLLTRVMKKKITKKEFEKVPAELKKLNDEIQETKTADRKRLDKILELIDKEGVSK